MIAAALSYSNDPAFVVALALAVGMLAQVLARHLRIPGIVVLLAAGTLLGPDVLGWINPESLGGTLQTLVGYAVAVILFEGGLILDIRGLRRQARAIRGLVTWGALVTALGGAAAAHWIMGWSLPISVLFGTLVIVTGPTVITPLLKRLRVESKTATVLEAEGVFGDAIGALVAVVTLEVVLTAENDVVHGALELVQRLGFGALLGLVAGFLMALLLRYEHIIPHGLDNVVTLSLVLLLYQVSNHLMHESGIVAVIAAGLAIGNNRTPLVSELKEFKEQLTVMLIGLLFVLLAADVRLDDLRDLGWRGVATVAALMLLVRPLNVLVGTWRSDLSAKQKGFLSWMAPRGIVAAAVASLFAQRLDAAGFTHGTELRALVFLVIAVTVTVQGLMGAPFAALLGLRRSTQGGYAILGAGPLARTLAVALGGDARTGVLIDTNAEACRDAERLGLKVIFGSGLSENVLQRAAIDERTGVIGMTSNDGTNYAFARRARREFRSPHAWVALASLNSEVRPSMLHQIDAEILFGAATNGASWSHRVDHNRATVQEWSPEDDAQTPAIADLPAEAALPLGWKHKERTWPYSGPERPHRKAMLIVLVANRHRADTEAAFDLAGWRIESSTAVADLQPGANDIEKDSQENSQ